MEKPLDVFELFQADVAVAGEERDHLLEGISEVAVQEGLEERFLVIVPGDLGEILE